MRAAAERYADHPAVHCEDYSLTYHELEVKIRSCAAALTDSGVGRGDLVALSAGRSIGLVTALLATMRIGAVACPVDLRQAPERARRMLAALRPRILLAEQGDVALVPDALAASDFGHRIVSSDASGALAAICPSENELAYVTHTSGSTGQPKAVAVPHRALANRIAWTQHRYPISVGDTVLHAGSLCFDLYFWASLAPLCFGAAIALAPEGAEADPGRLAEFIGETGVSVAHFVPSLLADFLQTADVAHLAKLRYVFCGGERLHSAVASRLLQSIPARLFNQYGPTEACIDMIDHEIAGGDLASGSIPLGRPIWETTARVLDAEGLPVADGEPGILYIGGACLAWGYLGMSGRTAAEFIPDPWSEVAGGRLYRTGDLVRQRPDGLFEFLGRADDQVKIRGVRMEPSEVEAALLGHPAVAAAVVTVATDAGEPTLVAHLVADGVSDDEIRSFLADQLPAAAIPSRYARRSSFPRLPSGKVDRASLSRAELDQYAEPNGTTVPLVTETERRVGEIWSDVLRVQPIGRTSHFFELGGQSLLALRMIAKVRRDFGTRVPVQAVFDAPTLERFSALLDNMRQ